MNMKFPVQVLVVLAAVGAGSVRAVPAVDNVAMTQRANSRVVDITYDLSGEAAIVTLGIETNGVALSDRAVTSLAGDVAKVVETGTGRHIVWNAGNDWPENLATNARAKVTAWATNAPPVYMVIDLGTGASNYPVYYYGSAEAVPGGVTNDLYKTARLVLRRVPATGGAGFYMGSPVGEVGRRDTSEDRHVVNLTQDFYIGVYEVTQEQWYRVMGTKPSLYNDVNFWATRPVERVSYYHIRENINNTTMAAVWPETTIPGSNSFMGVLRSKVGAAFAFDLPTDAQWEYACRAGTSGAFNDGTANATNLSVDVNLNRLGRYVSNQSLPVGSPPNTVKVGSYLPNAWGLYDMHGNNWEWVLDWFSENPEWTAYYSGQNGSVDPRGVSTAVAVAENKTRIIRGGAWNSGPIDCRSARRSNVAPDFITIGSVGFRISGNLP